MHVASSVDIAARPDQVFAVLADPARMPEWQSDLVSMEPLGDEPIGVGKRLRQVRKAGPGKNASTVEVKRYEPGSVLAIKSDDSKVKADGSWSLTPEGEGTRLDVDFTIEAGGFQGFILRLFEGAANKTAKKDLTTLKGMVEGRAPTA